MITTQDALARFCEVANRAPFITVDTEFVRQNTYFAELCLIQIATPEPDGVAVAIDTRVKSLDLTPVIDLFNNPDILKVFHAARQDIEIFYHQFQCIPKPFFDTQIAAMVCNFGDQVGYDKLVEKLTGARIDKSSRFTDWKARPLSQEQLSYAIADVTHLRDVYLKLQEMLEKNGRAEWVLEEEATLTNPDTYEIVPEDAWLKIKTRSHSPKFLAYVQALATFREHYALENNIPKTRVLKDDAILEIAAQKPKNEEQIRRLRFLQRDGRKKEIVLGLLETCQSVEALDPSDYPKLTPQKEAKKAPESLVDLLKILLKTITEREGVAPKLVASSHDLEAFALTPDETSLLGHGWRYDVFGKTATRLINGEVALSADGKYVEIVELK